MLYNALLSKKVLSLSFLQAAFFSLILFHFYYLKHFKCTAEEEDYDQTFLEYFKDIMNTLNTLNSFELKNPKTSRCERESKLKEEEK